MVPLPSHSAMQRTTALCTCCIGLHPSRFRDSLSVAFFAISRTHRPTRGIFAIYPPKYRVVLHMARCVANCTRCANRDGPLLGFPTAVSSAHCLHAHSGSCVSANTGSLTLGAVCELLLKTTAKDGVVPLNIGSLRLPTRLPRAFLRPATRSPSLRARPGQTTRVVLLTRALFGKPCLHTSGVFFVPFRWQRWSFLSLLSKQCESGSPFGCQW